MKLKCEHPNIIFNPNLKWLFCCKGFRHLVYPDHCLDFDNGKYFYNFPWCDFYRAKEMVNLDNIDSFVISNDDGEVYPVFMPLLTPVVILPAAMSGCDTMYCIFA